MRGSAICNRNHASAQIFQHALQIGHDVVIPIANDLIPGSPQSRCPVEVSLIFGMLATIRLDDYTPFLTQKIGYEAGNR